MRDVLRVIGPVEPPPVGTIPVRRRLAAGVFRGASMLSAAVGVAALVAIVVHVVEGAWPALNWTTLTTPTVGATGGIANAAVGTLWLALLTLLVVVPVGVGTATYVVEFAPPALRHVVLLASDVLSGVPSIVFGYMGFLAFVLRCGWGYSALAAALTLTMVVMPYMIRNAVEALERVPRRYREAGLALGFSRTRVVLSLVWPTAVPGMATGALLAIGVAVGETAPLLYTAAWSQQYPSWSLVHHAVGYLTYMVWAYSQEPFPQSIALAYVAALLLMVFVGVIAVVARVRGVGWIRGGVTRGAAREDGDV
jgi:phosphate transport system permease protein